MMNPLTLVLLALALLASGTQALAETPLKVIVMSGQSNMVGMRSIAADLPEAMQAANPQALFWTGEDWVPLAPGVSEEKGFGPEISFAYHYVQSTGESIGIIKHSVGGTSIGRWLPAQEKRNLYSVLADQVKAAAQSRPIEVVAMLWMQGERDARDPEMAADYAGNLELLITGSRAEFRAPEMPFILGRICPRSEAYTHVPLVRKAQGSCSLAGYRYINLDDLEVGGDKVHFTTSGIQEMGRRFAEALVEMEAKPRK